MMRRERLFVGLMAYGYCAALLGLISACFLTTGCRDSNGRQRVSGAVRFDGAPLGSGIISLRPVDKGPSAAGRIVNGTFELSAEKGPIPGKHRVEIESFRETGRMVALVDTPSMKMPEQKQVIPPQYNERTELTIDVTGTGTNHFEFNLDNNWPTPYSRRR